MFVCQWLVTRARSISPKKMYARIPICTLLHARMGHFAHMWHQVHIDSTRDVCLPMASDSGKKYQSKEDVRENSDLYPFTCQDGTLRSHVAPGSYRQHAGCLSANG